MRGDSPTSLIFFQPLCMSEAASVFGFQIHPVLDAKRELAVLRELSPHNAAG